MKIYLIHDHQRRDRARLYRRELGNQGVLEWELVPANKDTSDPVKNIAKAHKSCIRRAINEGLDSIVVLEDDVKFVCPGAFKRFLEVSVVDCDIVIAGSYDYTIKSRVTHPNLVPLERFSGLFCYRVNQRYYEKMLALPEDMNIDKAMAGANSYLCIPMYAITYDGYSAQKKAFTNYNQTLNKKLKLWNCKL